MTDWILVTLESPFAGDVMKNTRYARACIADCLKRGEAPFASHMLYTQPGVLDDTLKVERERGIAAGLAWQIASDYVVVYTDLGISAGMQRAIDLANAERVDVKFRTLSAWAA